MENSRGADKGEWRSGAGYYTDRSRTEPRGDALVGSVPGTGGVCSFNGGLAGPPVAAALPIRLEGTGEKAGRLVLAIMTATC